VLTRFIFEEDGQTLVEYAFLISLIALIAITGIAIFGSKVKQSLYDDISTQLDPTP